MSDLSPETAQVETLRCIYCQRTIQWPTTEAYPHQCLHCGRWTCYTAASSDTRFPPGQHPADHTPRAEQGGES